MQYPKLKPENNILLILGHVTNPNFQRAKWLTTNIIGKRLSKIFKPVHVCALFENDFQKQLWYFQHVIGNEFWACSTKVLVFINGIYIGNDDCLRHFLNIHFPMSLSAPSLSSPSLLQAGTQDLLDKMSKDLSARKYYVYFNIAIGGMFVGALVIKLYANICPDTCTRFLEFTKTTAEEKQNYGKTGYINTHIHRIQSPVFLQAGDIQESVPTFSDETFDIVHDRRGVVSFSNIGPDSNKCQFIISLNPNPWMNRKYVAFGQVVEGMDVLDKIESVPTFYESPTKPVVIIECGEVPLKGLKLKSAEEISGEHSKRITLSSENGDKSEILVAPSLDEVHQLSEPSFSLIYYDDLPKTLPFAQDQVHPKDVPSNEFLQERYLAGLYSIPKEVQVFTQAVRDECSDIKQGVNIEMFDDSGADRKQYYSLQSNDQLPYAGLSEDELRQKTRAEILGMFIGADDFGDSPSDSQLICESSSMENDIRLNDSYENLPDLTMEILLHELDQKLKTLGAPSAEENKTAVEENHQKNGDTDKKEIKEKVVLENSAPRNQEENAEGKDV